MGKDVDDNRLQATHNPSRSNAKLNIIGIQDIKQSDRIKQINSAEWNA